MLVGRAGKPVGEGGGDLSRAIVQFSPFIILSFFTVGPQSDLKNCDLFPPILYQAFIFILCCLYFIFVLF